MNAIISDATKPISETTQTGCKSIPPLSNATESISHNTSPVSGPPLATIFELLLRDRVGLLNQLKSDSLRRETILSLVLVILFCAGSFGASIGLYRGGVQILYACIKLPLVLLVTGVLATPALSALRVMAGREADYRHSVALILAATAFASLILAGSTPFVLLAIALDFGYHVLVLGLAGLVGFSGLAGTSLLWRGLPLSSRQMIAPAMLVILAVTGVQVAWTLRPYAVRPRTRVVPMVRALEGSALDALMTSLQSATGNYSDVAPIERKVRRRSVEVRP